MKQSSANIIPLRKAFDPSEMPSPEALQQVMDRSRDFLLGLQDQEGWWAGELIVDCTLCADYILFMHWMDEVDEDLQQKCVRHILRRRLPDGGWNIYHGGPSEVNASIKAYFALKLAGYAADHPLMQESRSNILRLGGIPRMNTYSRLYLAIMGQFPWEHVPTIPAELILLPEWFYFNIYEMSSWSRAMLIPLAILNHYRPAKQLPEGRQLHELYPRGTEQQDLSLRGDPKWMSWRNLFLGIDKCLKKIESWSWKPFRRLALKRAEQWMLARMEAGSDGLAAVFPAMLNSIMALKVLGYSKDHPVFQKAIRDFEELFVDDPEDFRIQPCLSPIWDTAINIIALVEAGLPADHAAIQKAASWLESKEVRIRGDWAFKNTHPEASGWAFEFNNEFYPDTDDTAMVLMALRLAEPADREELRILFERALAWQLSFQCRDGGWAAFDKDVTKHWLEKVPFADHNAILDPTCSDLTARTLELLGYIGFDRSKPVVRRALRQLRETQEPDGSWFGRWGVNYIYGTWQVLRGLKAIGEDMDQNWVCRGRDWLESCQNEDGGWGETCASYDDPALKGRGPSTPSQTAWALMGILACGDLDRPSIQRGLQYLIKKQDPDGSWPEPETTGTGFPKVFYLKYDMYRNNWPLLALATYRNYRKGLLHPESFYRVSE